MKDYNTNEKTADPIYFLSTDNSIWNGLVSFKKRLQCNFDAEVNFHNSLALKNTGLLLSNTSYCSRKCFNLDKCNALQPQPNVKGTSHILKIIHCKSHKPAVGKKSDAKCATRGLSHLSLRTSYYLTSSWKKQKDHGRNLQTCSRYLNPFRQRFSREQWRLEYYRLIRIAFGAAARDKLSW